MRHFQIPLFFALAIHMIFNSLSLFAQEGQPDPYELISNFQSKLSEVTDYQADLEIEVNVDFINIPVKHATIFFKQPDKLKFKSDEFIMLPKKGFNNQFGEILNEPYNAIYSGTEEVRGEECYLIKVIPSGKKPKVILATWWLNIETNLIMRAESNTRNEGTYTIDFSYKNPPHNLPSEMVISFEIEKLKLPMKFIGKLSGGDINDSQINEGVHEGKVYLRFSNYKINQQVSDDFFDDSENPEE